MVDCHYKVTDIIWGPTSNLGCRKMINKTTTKMLKLHSSGIAPIKNKAKSVLKFMKSKIKRKIIDKIELATILDPNLYDIVAYPDSDINELYTIMTQLGISKIPVASNPWSKKLIGFIDIEMLENILNKA